MLEQEGCVKSLTTRVEECLGSVAGGLRSWRWWVEAWQARVRRHGEKLIKEF